MHHRERAWHMTTLLNGTDTITTRFTTEELCKPSWLGALQFPSVMPKRKPRPVAPANWVALARSQPPLMQPTLKTLLRNTPSTSIIIQPRWARFWQARSFCCGRPRRSFFFAPSMDCLLIVDHLATGVESPPMAGLLGFFTTFC